MPTLLHVFPSFEVGGAQMRTARLIQGFGPGLSHRIAALDGCRDAERFLDPEADVQFIDGPPPGSSPAATRFHRGLQARLRPDLVCTYNWGSIDAALAARLPFGPPLVHHEDGFGRDELERPLRRRSVYRRLVLGGASSVIVPSTRLQDVAREHWRLPRRRVHLIPNGIELARYAPADRNPELRAELGIPLDAPLLGSVGGLRPEKNFGRLVDLHAALPAERGVWLLVVGDGVERESLERRASEGAGAGRVRFVGLQRDPIPFLRALDLFALTSDTEQMPIALVEAMACGLAAVASDVGDTRRV
ncbi:MAG: glycosyltransferase, partial [Planctomycetota bacterium]